MKNEQMKYGFLISNIDRSDKPGTHWCSILDIHPRKAVFLFDSFGILGIKNLS